MQFAQTDAPGAECIPTLQFKHLVIPSMAPKRPAWQATQFETPRASENWPLLHGTQVAADDAPVLVEKLPAPQGVQELSDATAPKRPFPQGSHELAPVDPEKRPTLQAKQADDPKAPCPVVLAGFTPNLPAAQARHALAPVAFEK